MDELGALVEQFAAAIDQGAYVAIDTRFTVVSWPTGMFDHGPSGVYRLSTEHLQRVCAVRDVETREARRALVDVLERAGDELAARWTSAVAAARGVSERAAQRRVREACDGAVVGELPSAQAALSEYYERLACVYGSDLMRAWMKPGGSQLPPRSVSKLAAVHERAYAKRSAASGVPERSATAAVACQRLLRRSVRARRAAMRRRA